MTSHRPTESMKPFLRQQLERYPVRLQELDFFLQQPDVAQDMERYRALTREHAEVSEVAGLFERFRQLESGLAQAREMLEDPEMADMAGEEIAAIEAEMPALEDELQRMLLPKDPDDVRNTFLEIRAGTGGDESALFAGDLLRMYVRYAERQGWRTRDRQRKSRRSGRLQGSGDPHRGRRRLWQAQVRVGRASRATRAGNRNAGAHPHQRLHRGRAAGARRGAGGADQPRRPAHRHLPRQRGRRPAREQDGLGRADHAHPDGHRGRMPGRPLPAPQQGQGHAGAGGTHQGKRAQRACRERGRHRARA